MATGLFDDLIPTASVPSNTDRLKMQAMGLPVVRVEQDPFAHILDPKQQAMAQSRMLANAQVTLGKSSQNVDTVRSQLRDVDELAAINKDHAGDQGSWGTAFKSMLPTFLQPAWLQRETELSTSAARGSRIPGEGTISDFDARQFGKMVGGPDKSPIANQQYIDAAKAIKQTAIDKDAFNNAFVQANGTSIGAERMWKQYVQSNPIFDQTGKVNPNRPGWDEYFASRAQNVMGGKRPNGAPRVALPGGPAPARAATKVVNWDDLK